MNTSVQTTSSGPQSTSDISDALSRYDVEEIKKYQRSAKVAPSSSLPGNNGFPFVGHLYPFLTNLHQWLDKQYEEYGPVFRFNTPVIKGVYLIGPDANQFVLQNEGKLFSNYLAWAPTFENLFDNNLLQRDFKDHKIQRKILQQAFKRPAIEGHIELMNPLLKQGICELPSGKTINTLGFVKRLLLVTGAEVFMGVKTGSQADKLNKAFADIVDGTADPLRMKALWFSPYAKGVKGNRLITQFIMDNIQQRRLHESRDMFSHLCHIKDENGDYVSDAQVKDHLIFLLFAAHDTTTSALNSMLYALASNPSWQQTLREEMQSIDKESVDFDDMAKLEKTGWTLNEALRMYPALHSIPRYALREFEFNGVKVPANTNVLLSSLLTHYMPEFWNNPGRFDPLRFSPERAEEKQHFYQYIPFGGGAHKCLGLHFAQIQSKIFLFYLLKNYQITKNPRMRTYKYNNVPLTFPTDGLPLTFIKLPNR